MTELLKFSPRRRPQFQRLDLVQLTAQVLESLIPRLAASEVGWELDAPSSAWLWADRQLVEQALLGLAEVALAEMPRGGELSVVIVVSPQGVELEVADSGRDSTETHRGTDEPPGLTLAQQVATLHGGQLEAAACPQGGTAYTLCLPRRDRQAAA